MSRRLRLWCKLPGKVCSVGTRFALPVPNERTISIESCNENAGGNTKLFERNCERKRKCRCKSTQRKSASKVPKFISNWLSRVGRSPLEFNRNEMLNNHVTHDILRLWLNLLELIWTPRFFNRFEKAHFRYKSTEVFLRNNSILSSICQTRASTHSHSTWRVVSREGKYTREADADGEGGGHSIALRHLGEGENDRPPPRDDGNRPRIRLASHQTLTPYPHFGKVYTWRKKLQLIY